MSMAAARAVGPSGLLEPETHRNHAKNRENSSGLDTIFLTPVALGQHQNRDIRAIQRPVRWLKE